MKLSSLLDPALPLPWEHDSTIPDGDAVTKDSIFLCADAPFATDLVLPVGPIGRGSKVLEYLALRANQIVIHTDDLCKTSLHYVAGEVMGDIPLTVKATDYVLRLNPQNRVSPAVVFAQLLASWKKLTVQRHIGARRDDVKKLIHATKIVRVSKAKEAIAQEAIATMVKAHQLVQQAASLRGKARKSMAKVRSAKAFKKCCDAGD